MTAHKFEPDQLVLVRMHHTEEWRLHHYSHESADMHVCGAIAWRFCIPYTPETAHLLGTSQPYEPPKPPQEYEWGQKVEVLWGSEWRKAIFIDDAGDIVSQPVVVLILGNADSDCVERHEIRPLPDDTADNADD